MREKKNDRNAEKTTKDITPKNGGTPTLGNNQFTDISNNSSYFSYGERSLNGRINPNYNKCFQPQPINYNTKQKNISNNSSEDHKLNDTKSNKTKDSELNFQRRNTFDCSTTMIEKEASNKSKNNKPKSPSSRSITASTDNTSVDNKDISKKAIRYVYHGHGLGNHIGSNLEDPRYISDLKRVLSKLSNALKTFTLYQRNKESTIDKEGVDTENKFNIDEDVLNELMKLQVFRCTIQKCNANETIPIDDQKEVEALLVKYNIELPVKNITQNSNLDDQNSPRINLQDKCITKGGWESVDLTPIDAMYDELLLARNSDSHSDGVSSSDDDVRPRLSMIQPKGAEIYRGNLCLGFTSYSTVAGDSTTNDTHLASTIGRDTARKSKSKKKKGKSSKPEFKSNLEGDFTIDTDRPALGKGAFGEVFSGKSKESGQIVAIKVIDKIRLQNASRSGTAMDFGKEVRILQLMKDERYVVICMGAYETKSVFYIVLEYCTCGDFESRIRAIQRRPTEAITELHIFPWLAQMMEACAYIHDLNIIHKDIKPPNFLIHMKTSSQKEYLKMADFGLAEVLDPHKLCMSTAGTPLYMSPERYLKQPFSYDADVFACGIIFAQLLNRGKHPFILMPKTPDGKAKLNEEKLTKACVSEITDRPRTFKSQVQSIFTREDISLAPRRGKLALDLLKRMVAHKPQARPSAAQCLHHDWFESKKKSHSCF